MEDMKVSNRVLISFGIAALVATAAGCSTTENANGNANAAVAIASPGVSTQNTRTGPDSSEITTSTDANGVRTETRVFHNNRRVEKVVVTTRDGKRTTTVYARSGESKDLKDDVGDALSATGDALADAAGWTADKAEDIAGKTKEGVKAVGDKTEDVAKEAGSKTKEGAKTVADKTKSGAQTVAEKTGEGAKKTGKAIKKVVTP
jgi:hypothetical protein